MVEIFSEIETFFQQKQFSQEQLDALKVLIESKYKDNQIRKSASSAINIKLLQFALSGPLEPRVSKNQKDFKVKPNGKRPRPLPKEEKEKKKTKKAKLNNKGVLSLERNSKDMVELFYEQNINQSLENLAKVLQLTQEELLRHLKDPNANISSVDHKFNETLWEANKKWIAPRIKKLSREAKKPTIKRIKKYDIKKTYQAGVYGKLAKAKSIGSFIYTRM